MVVHFEICRLDHGLVKTSPFTLHTMPYCNSKISTSVFKKNLRLLFQMKRKEIYPISSLVNLIISAERAFGWVGGCMFVS